MRCSRLSPVHAQHVVITIFPHTGCSNSYLRGAYRRGVRIAPLSGEVHPLKEAAETWQGNVGDS